MNLESGIQNSEFTIQNSQFSLPRYPRYRASGVEWLGDVPEHWDVQSLRAVAGLYVEKNQPDLPVLSVYREYGVILKDSRDDNHNATSLDTSNYKVVRPGDLAVNKMKAWQGSLGVSEHHGIVSPAYITCRLNQEKVTGRYIHYLLRSKSLIGALDSISYGVRVGQWDMRFEDFKKVGITIPPKPEQDRIVAFLDKKTAEIATLISKKQRQIELLDEQKAILINRAVTRGLNPNAKLKPSGIDWIGDIPQHWEVKKARNLTSKIGDGLHGTPIYDDSSDIAFINGNNLTAGRVIVGEATRRVSAKTLRDHFHDFDQSTILLSINGTLGSAAVYRGERIMLGKSAAYLKFKSEVDPLFAYYVLTSVGYVRHFYREASGTTIHNLSLATLRSLPITLPSRDEQRAILDELRSLEEQIGVVHHQIQAQIRSLKILRSTLIAHTVTGKVKVNKLLQ
ncbi:MAG: restriction endonuclease subunit S [Terrimicrobiaceae bacterium]